MTTFVRARSLVVAGVTISALVLSQLLSLTLGSVYADATHQATIGMPFTGNWAYNIPTTAACGSGSGQTSHPSCHTTYYGDWATDDFNTTDGTPVHFNVISTYGGSASYYWIPYANGTCGQRTVIGIKVGGVDVGSIYFEHLNNAVTSGTITNGMQVGTVHDWGGCNPGPHVHIELKNATNYACYTNYSNANYTAGMIVNEGSSFGILGSTNTGAKQECSSTSSTLPPGKGGGAASTWSSGRLDGWIAQATPYNGSNIGHIYVDSTWHPWETIIPPDYAELMASQPAVVSWSSTRIDIFARSQTGSLIHAWLDSGTWHGWEDKGGCIIGAPTVTTWAVNRLDVFAEGCNSTGPNLYHLWLGGDPVAWHDWELISTAQQRMASPPSAVSWGPSRLDIFAQGDDSTLLHTYIDTSWHDWDSRGGCIIGQPAVSSWTSNRLDAFAQSCNSTGGNFVHIWFQDGTWHNFDVVPNSTTNIRINGVLGATSWANNRIDMFTRSATNSLTHWWFDGTGWQGPEDKGGSIATF